MMDERTTTEWTIDELGAQVALALSVDYEGQPNGQISDIPNRRTIRYYTTLGLLDRPAAMRGRTALYRRRHLMQVVAIKRLQLDGLSLSEIQQRLAAVTDARLADIARLPMSDDARRSPPSSSDGRERGEASGGLPFWLSAPAEADVETRPEVASSHHDRATPTPLAGSASAERQRLEGLVLGSGVSLVLAPNRPLGDTDLEAIEAAAAPLLKLLHQRGLVSPARGDDR